MSLTQQTFFSQLLQNAADAIAARTPGPDEIFRYDDVIAVFEAAHSVFPEGYRDAFCTPLLDTFERLGPDGWFDVLRRDPELRGVGLMGLDLIQGAAQRVIADEGDALMALQEVVSDLYDGFLSDADRGSVKPPEFGVLPPVVKWGRPGFGPYIWPAASTVNYRCATGLVNMPPAFASGGLAAWAALGHEGAHEILHANEGLLEELAEIVREKIENSSSQAFADDAEKADLGAYWAARIDESASDVMGVVNMGPAACLGLIAYFRALPLASGHAPVLASSGSPDGPHPAPLARCYLMAETIGACSFDDRAEWRRALIEEGDADAPGPQVDLGGLIVSLEAIKMSARIAARAILTAETEALEDHALCEIQDWRQSDQDIVETLTEHAVIGGAPVSNAAVNGIYAAHAVAAAIMASLKTGDVQAAQSRMIEIVTEMHAFNPAWSDLAGDHLGDFHGPHFFPGHEVHEGIHGRHTQSPLLCDCDWFDGHGDDVEDMPRGPFLARSGANVPGLGSGSGRRRSSRKRRRHGPFMAAAYNHGTVEDNDDGSDSGGGHRGRGGVRVPFGRSQRRLGWVTGSPIGNGMERRRAAERWEGKAGDAVDGLWRKLLGR